VAAAVLLPDSYVGWYPGAVRAARRVLREQHFDAIYSTSPPETSHLVGRSLHRSSGLPWLADFRDPWMNLHLLAPPTPMHAALHRRLEASVCREAVVTVTTDWHEELLRESYPGVRVTKISNGYDAAEIDMVSGVSPSAEQFRVIHAGMLTQARTAVPFVRAVHRFLERRPEARARLNIIFAGPREDENDRVVAQLQLDDVVTFRESIPHGDVLRAQKESHVLLLIKHDNPAYSGLVPGKLYEYIGLARPILALAPEGEAQEIVKRLGRGEVAGPADVGGIALALERMYDRYRAGTLDVDYNHEPHPELDRARLAGDMAAVLDSVVGK
jgi:glycosyltransferase involved in cell wall biosynthesis